MKIFIDTANLNEIEEISNYGIIKGVTTNPSLIAKEKESFEEIIKKISQIIDGPISAEVLSEKAIEMIEEGRKLSKLHKNIVIKLPTTLEGLKACKQLSKDKIKTNMTLIFSVNQAILAIEAGATYISPFIGRLDDIGTSGIELISKIKKVLLNYELKTEIIGASIRNVKQVEDLALIGADIATVPYKLIKEMINHPLTDKGLEKFNNDWKLKLDI